MATALADPDELEKSNNVDVIYLDFPKVFDKVDHGILLIKLKKDRNKW